MNADRPLLEQVLEFAEVRGITLPVFSDVALKVQQAARSDSFDLSDVERAIGDDPALVTEILRAANSAFFGGLAEVSTIRTAIMRLGLQRVSNLVFLATEKNRYTARHPAMSGLMADLWHHSSACAMAAEWLARKVRYPQLGETVFIGALVHDIGKLFLLRVIDEMQREPGATPVPIELVHEVLESAHTEVGHRLLTSWHLPEVYQAIVRDHHAEHADPANVALQIVRLADRACNKVGLGLRAEPTLVLVALEEAATLGLSDIALAELEVVLEDVAAHNVIG